MDLPDDKKQVVLGTSEEKKRLMVRDHLRQTNQMPPKFYIAKFSHVMEAENVKVHKIHTHSHNSHTHTHTHSLTHTHTHIYTHSHTHTHINMLSAFYFYFRKLENVH